MPINMSDPRIKREKVPPAIGDVGRALRTHFGLSAVAVGVQGNSSHATGFHRSENWLRNSPDSTRRDTDYSLQGALNHSADPDTCCALDVTPGTTARMIAMTGNVHRAALNRDPRLNTVQEFAGTLNGTTVTRIRCSDGVILSPFDKSHLWHLHASFYRARALQSHAGFTAVLLATTTHQEDDMTPDQAATLQRLDERVGTIIGDLDAAPSVGGINHVKRRLALIEAKLTALALGGVDLDSLAVKVAALVVAAPDNPLTEQDSPVIEAALRKVLRAGVGA